MARVPGTPEEKLTLLSTIDQTTLPHLVGDILYFIYHHRDVKVVDGPGDGKRDIHSIRPDGANHITQCKYHQNTSATVSSRETDELVLALMKFGCKAGLFVTTGKISPQGKREYLDNYKNFELDFFDGIRLVDTVLASPVLSSIWFDGESFTQTCKNFIIPFIIRTVQEDKPIVRQSFKEFSAGGVFFRFDSDCVDESDFKPYRSPFQRTWSENDSSFLRCHSVICSHRLRLHDVPNYIKSISHQISQQLDESVLPIIVRFGIPSFVRYKANSAKDESYQLNDRVRINGLKPISFVIDKSRSVIEEKKWVVVQDIGNWVFPSNLSTLEVDWAGWINREHNTIFMQEMSWPISLESYWTFEKRKHREHWLGNSLFAVGSRKDCEALIAKLPNTEKPNWYCSYGLDGYLLGWLHPVIEIVERGDFSFQYNPSTDAYELRVRKDIPVDKYKEVVRKVRTAFSNLSLEEVDFKKAHLISAAADKDLLPEYTEFEFRSAELYHYYEEVPSPVYLKKRFFLFVRMWQVPASPSEARKSLSERKVSLPSEVDVHWDARRGPKTEKTFVLCSLIFTCPANLSADEYFYSIEEVRDRYLETLAQYILSIWDEAVLATVHFWKTEIGFKLEDNTFEGNPWVMFLKNDASNE